MENSVTIDDKSIERKPIRDALLFSTPDLYQVAFLVSRGHTIAKINHRGRYKFWFQRTPELEMDLSDFHANGKVGIRDLLSGIYAVKRMMREEDAKR
jgi:hypothetical protein